jgi:hypothetical protein
MPSNRIQEWYDTMCKGLASQGWKRGTNKDGECVYRGNNSRCGIGYILPDDAPIIPINDSIASASYRLFGLGEISYEEDKFMVAAQRAHDRADNLTLREKFRSLGMECNLVLPSEVLEQAQSIKDST